MNFWRRYTLLIYIWPADEIWMYAKGERGVNERRNFGWRIIVTSLWIVLHSSEWFSHQVAQDTNRAFGIFCWTLIFRHIRMWKLFWRVSENVALLFSLLDLKKDSGISATWATPIFFCFQLDILKRNSWTLTMEKPSC